MNTKKCLQRTLLLGAAGLSMIGCLDSTKSTDQSTNSSVLPPVQELFYDLPTSMTGAQGSALAKSANDTAESIWDAYKPVPAYIALAEEAKEGVQAFILEMEQYDLPDNIVLEEDGLIISSVTVDTTILGATQKFHKVEVEENGKTVLFLNYWKNAREQYRGNFYLFDQEGQDSGAAIYVHFSNHNEDTFGRRMVVVFSQPVTNLVGEKMGDPAVVRVSAVRKGDRVLVSGGSWHPNFVDEDGFWEEGGKVYGFVAAGNTEKDVSVMKVGFGPDTMKRGELFTKYAMDKRVMERGAVAFRTYLSADTAAAKLVLWSLENDQPVDWLNYAAILEYQPTTDIETLTGDDLARWLDLNQTAILLGDDQGLKDFLFFSKAKQPIFFAAGAVIIGNIETVEGEVGVDATELEAIDSEEAEPDTYVGIDAVDIETMEIE